MSIPPGLRVGTLIKNTGMKLPLIFLKIPVKTRGCDVLGLVRVVWADTSPPPACFKPAV
jgi:hypothetical protein